MVSVAVMIAYLSITSLIGVLAIRHNKSSGEFFLGSAGLGVAFVVSMTFSEVIGGTATIGPATEAATIGMGAVWSTWAIALGCVCFVFAFGRFYRVLGATRNVRSVASAYGALFGRRSKTIVLLIVVVVYTCLFALQPVAAKSILAPMFGISEDLIYIFVGVAFVILACMGGLKGLSRMNKVHAVVMWVGLAVVAALAVTSSGGFASLSSQVPEGFMNPLYPGVATVVVWLAGGVLSQMNSSIMAMITLSTGSLRAAKKGSIAAAVLLLVFALFPAVIGLAALVIMPGGNPETALYSVSLELHPLIGGVCAVAVIAAIFSSAPSLLLIVGTTVAEDFYREFIKPDAGDKEIMRVARLAMVIAGSIAIVLGSQTTSIFSELLSIFQIRSIVAVVLIAFLVCPRVNERSVFWSMLCGGGLAAVWHFLGSPFGIQPLAPALVAGTAMLVLFTLTSRYKISDEYSTYLRCQMEYWEQGNGDVKIDIGKVNRMLSEAKAERR